MHKKGELINKIILLLIIALIFWLGRLSVQYQIHSELTPIQTISEINPKIPMIEIVDIQDAKIIGSVNKPEIRIKSGEQVAVPDADNNFELDIQHLGFIGARRPVIKVKVPDWARYVASKKGKYFYELDEKSAKNLSVANMIFFASEEDATKAGYLERNR